MYGQHTNLAQIQTRISDTLLLTPTQDAHGEKEA